MLSVQQIIPLIITILVVVGCIALIVCASLGLFTKNSKPCPSTTIAFTLPNTTQPSTLTATPGLLYILTPPGTDLTPITPKVVVERAATEAVAEMAGNTGSFLVPSSRGFSTARSPPPPNKTYLMFNIGAPVTLTLDKTQATRVTIVKQDTKADMIYLGTITATSLRARILTRRPVPQLMVDSNNNVAWEGTPLLLSQTIQLTAALTSKATLDCS